MTIFIQVAKLFLTTALNDQINASTSKDPSFFQDRVTSNWPKLNVLTCSHYKRPLAA